MIRKNAIIEGEISISTMKNITILLLLTLWPAFALAQEKEHLLTLHEGEMLDTDNTTVQPTSSGADYVITTQYDYDGKYYRYTRSVKGESVGVDIRLGEFITTGKEDGKEYFRINATGKKYGPYESVSPRYDEKKQLLYGYSYEEDGNNYFVDQVNNKSYGPLDQGGLWHIDEKNLVYSYAETDNETGKLESFLIENGEKSGPYEQVSYRMPGTAATPPLIVYMENGKYYVKLQQYKGIAFGAYPIASEIRNGWVIEGAAERSDKVKWIYLPDGQKLESSQTVKHLVNYQGNVMKAEHVAGGGSDAAYKVSFKGKEIGTYAIKKSNRSDLSNSDFFDHFLIRVEVSNNWPLAYRDENYLFSESRGLIGPLTQDEIRMTYFFPGGYATIKADSTLQMNGKNILEDVIMTDYRDYPENWWAFQQRGDYVYPYRNGKEIPLTELPEQYRYYNTEDKPLVKVKRGDEYFIRVKGLDKLLGPIDKYDAFTVSGDGKHYAVVRGIDDFVAVDGKVVTKGFNIVYNEKLNAFHWFDQEGQKIYLYTYKL
ncbi:MAG: hypothetical protein E4H10_01740 [Bacteroidia bacterium]|nr:MAG: hypothetical protein E4H10_01740 [Bacteroidia bacterium]